MLEFVRFTLRLPTDLALALREMARREDRSVHAQVLYILRRFIEEHGNV